MDLCYFFQNIVDFLFDRDCFFIICILDAKKLKEMIMATKRRIFYSFHYEPDNWCAGTVRNIGVVEGNKPATDNDWETIKKGGDAAIKKWIASQMNGRSCTVVLVGAETAGRKWINHEIIKSWDDKMGVVGINIHGLKNSECKVSKKGKNPFDFIGYGKYRKEIVLYCEML